MKSFFQRITPLRPGLTFPNTQWILLLNRQLMAICMFTSGPADQTDTRPPLMNSAQWGRKHCRAVKRWLSSNRSPQNQLMYRASPMKESLSDLLHYYRYYCHIGLAHNFTRRLLSFFYRLDSMIKRESQNLSTVSLPQIYSVMPNEFFCFLLLLFHIDLGTQRKGLTKQNTEAQKLF